MKKFIATTTVLLTVLTACAPDQNEKKASSAKQEISLQESSAIDRQPATKSLARCVSWFVDVVGAFSDPTSVRGRYMEWRGRRIDYLENSLEKFEADTWSSNVNLNSANEILIGVSKRRSRILKKIKVKAGNPYTPAFYQYYDGHETWGVIDNLASYESTDSSAYKGARAELRAWLNTFKDYRVRKQKQINAGFQAKMHMEELEQYVEGGTKAIPASEYENTAKVTKELPYVEDDGSIKMGSKNFSDWDALEVYVNNQRLEVKHIFSHGLLDEAFLKSEIYKVDIEQYQMFRRLQFLRDRLDDIPDHKRTGPQNTMIKQINEALSNSQYYPPREAVKKGQRIEIKAEVKANRAGIKSKNAMREQFKFQLTRDTVVKIKDKSIIRAFSNYLLSGVVIGGGLGINTVIYNLFPEKYNSPYRKYVPAWITAKFNNWKLNKNGITYEIAKCADTEVQYDLKEFCLADLIKKHTMHLFLKSQLKDDYNYKKDPRFLEIRQKVISAFIKRRADRRYAELHADTKHYLENDAYPQFADELFLSLFREAFEMDEAGLQGVENLLTTYSLQGTTRSLTIQLNEFGESNPEVTKEIRAYFRGRDAFVAHLQEYGTFEEANMKEWLKSYDPGPIPDSVRRKLEELDNKVNHENHVEGSGHIPAN